MFPLFFAFFLFHVFVCCVEFNPECRRTVEAINRPGARVFLIGTACEEVILIPLPYCLLQLIETSSVENFYTP